MAVIKFYPLKFRLRTVLLNSCSRPMRLTITRHRLVVVTPMENYAAILGYRLECVSARIKNRSASREDID